MADDLDEMSQMKVDKQALSKDRDYLRRKEKQINTIIGLNDIPIWFFCVVCIIVISLMAFQIRKTISMLIEYLMIVIGETILFRSNIKISGYRLAPFWSYEVIFENGIKSYTGHGLFFQIIGNVLLFIPLGF